MAESSDAEQERIAETITLAMLELDDMITDTQGSIAKVRDIRAASAASIAWTATLVGAYRDWAHHARAMAAVHAVLADELEQLIADHDSS